MASSSRLRIPHQKVCVVCYRVAKDCGEYWIYIVDLKSAAGDYFRRRDPTFRFKRDCFSSPCFCIVGSTLYVFQGYDYDRDADKFITRGMSVAKAPLKEIKFWPTAVPTPDGKQILVVPTGFRELRDDWICSFELYDPSRQTSTVIRALPLERSGHRVLSVEFIGPRTVLLRTENDQHHTGCLILDDLQGADPKWVDQREWSRNIERMGIRGSFLIRHGWCLKASSAYDISGDGDRGPRRGFKYPASSGEDLSSSTINYDITPLQGDGDLDTSLCCCTLRVGRTLRPFVMLDVYKFDFVKEVAEVGSTRLRGVEIVKSIRFYDAQQLLDEEDDSFTATKTFFSIPPSSH